MKFKIFRRHGQFTVIKNDFSFLKFTGCNRANAGSYSIKNNKRHFSFTTNLLMCIVYTDVDVNKQIG